MCFSWLPRESNQNSDIEQRFTGAIGGWDTLVESRKYVKKQRNNWNCLEEGGSATIHTKVVERSCFKVKVIKRDGRTVEYDRNKILVAIRKANAEVDQFEKVSDDAIDGIIAGIE